MDREEIIYQGPGGPGSQSPQSSLAAVRGPDSAAGAVDRAHGSDARTHRPRLAPSGTGPHSEPFGMLDLEELPETYGIDEVEILYKDPWWVFVYWEVTEGGLAVARAQLGPAGASARLVLRCFTTQGHEGPAPLRELRDVPLTWNHGRRYLDVPRPGSVLRVAVGLLSREGYFAPIAHSSHLRLPPPQPGPPGPVEWLHVQPPRGRGEQRERLTLLGRPPAHQERGLRWRVAGLGDGEPDRGAQTAPGAGRTPPGTAPRSGGLR